MSKSRALVGCAVLSVQDSCFIYPCCNSCLCKVKLENKRASCGRCGYTGDLQNVDYRYRVSLKVSRNQDIFGVTVFGGCLNPFFGITATDLQRFVELEKSDAKLTVQQLLVKSVEDCFIGKSLIVGLKVPHGITKMSVLSGELVAYQIISPCESLMGCTVIAYLKSLLETNSNSESTKIVCPTQHNISHRDELSSFDYTPPSCAQLDSQSSSVGFGISSLWQSPGFQFPPDGQCCYGCGIPSRASQSKSFRCQLKEKTWDSPRKSLSSSCDMFASLAHCNVSASDDGTNTLSSFSSKKDSELIMDGKYPVSSLSGVKIDAKLHEASLDGYFGPNMSFTLDDVNNFVMVDSGQAVQMTHEQDRCLCTDSSVPSEIVRMPRCEKLTSPIQNINVFRQANENLGIKNTATPKFIKTSASRAEKVVSSFAKEMLTFSNKKQCVFKRKRTAWSQNVAGQKQDRCIRHQEQSEGHFVNCTAKQELIVCDDHGKKYNCSVDLFASGQSSLDMNLSGFTETAKENEPKINANYIPKIFSPYLQSTPVSHCQISKELKNGRSLKHFSCVGEMMDSTCNISANEWSKELFENSF